MESQQQQFLNQQFQVEGKIEFQAIRNTYSVNENLYCYFMVPATMTGPVKPEAGDFVGIYKVYAQSNFLNKNKNR